MPTELMQEFIGKVCAITLFNDSFGIAGKIISVEGNWIKVSEKEKIRLVNGDMIRDIKMLPEHILEEIKPYFRILFSNLEKLT